MWVKLTVKINRKGNGKFYKCYEINIGRDLLCRIPIAVFMRDSNRISYSRRFPICGEEVIKPTQDNDCEILLFISNKYIIIFKMP